MTREKDPAEIIQTIAITPQGEYEQLGKLLSGLSRQKGWRGVAARLVAAVALLIIVAVIALGVIQLFR
jgi:hypothetical protein